LAPALFTKLINCTLLMSFPKQIEEAVSVLILQAEANQHFEMDT
jgi:hypothetical protein